MPPTSPFFSITVWGNARAAQADRCAEAGHARADHDHVEVVGHAIGVALVDAELAVETQPRADHRPVRCRHLFADATPHHIHQLVDLGGGQGGGAARLPRKQRVACRGADFLLHVVGQATGVVIVDAADMGALVALGQPAPVAGQMHQHHQQRRHIGAGQRRVELAYPVAMRGGESGPVGARKAAVVVVLGLVVGVVHQHVPDKGRAAAGHLGGCRTG
ncbi:hypothetical protein [Cupriavidus sp. H19C3]|uniref:hypothetical protein n=1 Tax=Cupriavidus sp. H19C3 TaxID=3241603 RepID=UPI003BF7F780